MANTVSFLCIQPAAVARSLKLDDSVSGYGRAGWCVASHCHSIGIARTASFAGNDELPTYEESIPQCTCPQRLARRATTPTITSNTGQDAHSTFKKIGGAVLVAAAIPTLAIAGAAVALPALGFGATGVVGGTPSSLARNPPLIFTGCREHRRHRAVCRLRRKHGWHLFSVPGRRSHDRRARCWTADRCGYRRGSGKQPDWGGEGESRV